MVYLVYSVCTEYNKEWAGALTSVSKGSTVKDMYRFPWYYFVCRFNYVAQIQ